MDWLNEGLLLVPWPQEIDETGEGWPLPRHLLIQVLVPVSQETWRTAEALAADLEALTGVEAVVAPYQDSVEGIRLALRGAADSRTTCPSRSEGYGLAVSPDGAAIISFDEAGLAHGAQTLLQLVAFS